eukprot:1158940-Pelagomonas_calceolata.AAC.4
MSATRICHAVSAIQFLQYIVYQSVSPMQYLLYSIYHSVSPIQFLPCHGTYCPALYCLALSYKMLGMCKAQPYS